MTKRYKRLRKFIDSLIPKDGGELIEINEPVRCSETELQFSLYKRLIEDGLNARLEVKHMTTEKIKGARKQISRFDIVVFDCVNIIIEVKLASNFGNDVIKRQFKKYSQYNAELVYCVGFQDIEQTILKVKSILGK